MSTNLQSSSESSVGSLESPSATPRASWCRRHRAFCLLHVASFSVFALGIILGVTLFIHMLNLGLYPSFSKDEEFSGFVMAEAKPKLACCPSTPPPTPSPPPAPQTDFRAVHVPQQQQQQNEFAERARSNEGKEEEGEEIQSIPTRIPSFFPTSSQQARMKGYTLPKTTTPLSGAEAKEGLKESRLPHIKSDLKNFFYLLFRHR